MEITVESIGYKREGEFAFKPKLMAYADIDTLNVGLHHIDCDVPINYRHPEFVQFWRRKDGWYSHPCKGFPIDCVFDFDTVVGVKYDKVRWFTNK